MLTLEAFQAGLMWITILNKRENFRLAFDCFDPSLIAHYGEEKVIELLSNEGIIRHRGKILAAINFVLTLQNQYKALAISVRKR